MSTYKDLLHSIATRVLENSHRDLKDLSLREKYTLYRVSSCLYYIHDTSIMSDEKFDLICKDLLDNYDPMIIHVSKKTLRAGTGYDLKYGLTTINICTNILNIL
jgi:hypothetical protein